MRCHTTTCCNNTLSSIHTRNIFWGSFNADKHNFFAFFFPAFSIFCIKYSLTNSSTWGCRQTCRDNFLFCLWAGLGGLLQLIQRRGLLDAVGPLPDLIPGDHGKDALAILECGKAQRLEGRETPLQGFNIFGARPLQEFGRDLDHDMRLVGAVRLSVLLKEGVDAFRFRLDILPGQRLCQQELIPRHVDISIHQRGMSLHAEGRVAISVEAVPVLRDIHGGSPVLIALGEASVPILLPDSVGQHIEHAMEIVFVHDLGDGGRIETVVMVMVFDGLLDGVPAADVGRAGFPVLVQLAVLSGVFAGMIVDRQIAQLVFLPFLLAEQSIRQIINRARDKIHVVCLPVLECVKQLSQKVLLRQKHAGLLIINIMVFKREDDVLPNSVLVGMAQNLSGRLFKQPGSVFLLLGKELFIQSLVQFFVSYYLPSISWVVLRSPVVLIGGRFSLSSTDGRTVFATSSLSCIGWA